MCGIIGIFGAGAYQKAEQGIEIMHLRGRDDRHITSIEDGVVGHCLHSIVDNLRQPLKGEGVFSSNCEIFNWKELCKKHDIDARNDSDMLFKLLEKKGIENIKKVLEIVDGVYAFSYTSHRKTYLARDILGVKPVFYDSMRFSFASERKELDKLGYRNVDELNQRKILFY